MREAVTLKVWRRTLEVPGAIKEGRLSKNPFFPARHYRVSLTKRVYIYATSVSRHIYIIELAHRIRPRHCLFERAK